MGTVWRAEDQVLGREVAVKEVTFPPGLSEADRRVLRERTRREARAAARLDHPSAVTVYDVVEEDDKPYLVLEYVEARTLAEVTRTDGPLSPQRTAEIGLALLGALEAAHKQGILHRDVKPSNVLVRPDGRVVLTDFGIATATGDSTITHTGLLLGSPAYIAPERARGEKPGPPSDLWSLGATLFTAVEGKPPYDGGEPLVTVTRVVSGEHEPFVAAGALQPVLEGLLEKDPAQRLDLPSTRRMLEQVARQRPAPATRVLAAPAAVQAAGATAAIDLGEVHEDLAAAPAPAPAPHAPRARSVPLVREQDRPPRRRLAPVALGAAAVLLAAGGVYLASGAGEDARVAAGEPRTSSAPAPTTGAAGPAEQPADEPEEPSEDASEGTSDEPAADDDAAPAAAGLPAGWSTDTGGSGWTVALPPGYQQTRSGEYVGPNRRTLRVDTTGAGGGGSDAVADREQQAQDFKSRHPSYREIRIEAVDYRGYEAADWEFTYDGLHVINRVFVVDGRGHSLFFQTRAGDFAAARSDFDGIVRAFRPVGA
jgi:hypothetical protein